MSLAGAMNTAISGLDAQSAAFANISDNVANSQTVGYKGVDTSFIDFLSDSSATANDSSTVASRPDYTNETQGTVAASTDALALAISGQGMFAVNQATGSVSGTTAGSQTTFAPTQYYTRAGDFSLDKNGYVVNTAGEYLDGWTVNPATGAVDTTSLKPIQVNQNEYAPVATSSLTLSANLPATPAAGSSTASQVDIYDSQGTSHQITLNWTQVAGVPDTWTVQIVSPDDLNTAPANAVTDASGNPVIGSAEVTFADDGTISSITNPVSDYGTVGSVATATTGTTASLNFTTSLIAGQSQSVSLNLGTFGESTGMTQYAGTTYALRSITQNGVAPGSFSGVSAQSNGDVVVNYDNGQSRTIAQVPVVTFNDADALQSQNGQAYTETLGSGTPSTETAGTNGAGSLVTGSVEDSNVDIATQFSQLIVAQSAYGANAKVITTANEMMQATLNIIS
jgi:flagellar hook protein FlgE